MTSQQRLEELKRRVKELAERIDQLEEQSNNVLPITGLLGRWAKHPEHGDVPITMDRPLESRAIKIAYLSEEGCEEGMFRYVSIDDLKFPEQTTRPQDVPVGEAWLIDADNGDNSTTNTPAVKESTGLWITGKNNEGGVNAWSDNEVTLITPLIPARPHDTPETVTTVEEYEALPEGSVVAKPGEDPWTHKPYVWEQVGATIDDVVLAGTTRHVLRYGCGE